KRKDRHVTIVLHTDGDLASRQYRVPVWAFEAGKWSALLVGLLVVLFFAFAGPIGRAAARVPGLERQVARLEEENSRVQQLAAALNRAEANYQELRTMLGVRGPREKEAAGTDLAYGLFVLLRHSSGYETMYGHASRLLVREGDSVQAGQVIALSGNSGRSTAPHLHFEIRREGKSLDPLTVVKQEN